MPSVIFDTRQAIFFFSLLTSKLFLQSSDNICKKNMVCRVSKNNTRQRSLFAECQEKTLRKGLTAAAGRRQPFAEYYCLTLGKLGLCRVFGTRQTTFLPSAFSLTLGKQPLYRVPDKKHSVKSGILGKEAVSGSETFPCPSK